jgi:putative addiction module component (TIGR02574 family)
MSAAELLEQAKALPLEDRIDLAKQLCGSLAEEGHHIDDDLTPAEVAELDRRAENALAHPERCRPLDDVVDEGE